MDTPALPASPHPSRFTLRLFGRFEAFQGEAPIGGLHLREGSRLLAYLTLHALHGEPVAYRTLAEQFWPSEARINPGSGGGDFPSTRQAVRSLRLALGMDAPRVAGRSRGVVSLDLEGAQVDLAEFDRLSQGNDPEAWREAVQWYRGPVLADWSEPWIAAVRNRYRRAYERLLWRLIEHARGLGDSSVVEDCLCRLTRSAPADETAARGLMRLLLGQGRGAEAAEVFEGLREALARNNTRPDPETETVGVEIRQQLESLDGLTCRRGPAEAGARVSPVPASDSTAAPAAGAPDLVAPPTSGGAVTLDSHFYLVRPTDGEFRAAVLRRDSIVLVKGAGQMGKTSLLARGLEEARNHGCRVVLTDLQTLNREHLQSPDALYQAFALHFVLQLDLDPAVLETWNPRFGASMNLELFLRRQVLTTVAEPLVWAMDEVDRLFPYAFSSEVFGLFRSWHNRRSLEPGCPWTHLTLAMAYATEAHLFIKDLNQSPFNVGTRLTLADFSAEQVAELNRRYGSPLATPQQLERFHALVNGQPYLVRRAFDEMVNRGFDFETLESRAARDDGPFADHLRRQLGLLKRDEELRALVRGMLQGDACPDLESFYRLRSAGLITGDSPREAQPRCRLYHTFFSRHLI